MNIDVEHEQVNGTLCTMVSLSWPPEVKHKVVDRLRRGELQPHASGSAYKVPVPYRCLLPSRSHPRSWKLSNCVDGRPVPVCIRCATTSMG